MKYVFMTILMMYHVDQAVTGPWRLLSERSEGEYNAIDCSARDLRVVWRMYPEKFYVIGCYKMISTSFGDTLLNTWMAE